MVWITVEMCGEKRVVFHTPAAPFVLSGKPLFLSTLIPHSETV
jgi:hypothetical protein